MRSSAVTFPPIPLGEADQRPAQSVSIRWLGVMLQASLRKIQFFTGAVLSRIHLLAGVPGSPQRLLSRQALGLR